MLHEAILSWRRAVSSSAPCAAWEHEVWNRSSARAFLSAMSLLDGFERLAKWPERQKDFFMYVVLSRLGGIFVDADVVPLRPPAAWLEEVHAMVGKAAAGARLIVGLEAHGSDADARAWRWAGRTQLAMWAVAAAPGHPVLVRAADRYLQAAAAASHAQEAQAQYRHSIAMGPGLLTAGVSEWLRETRRTDLEKLESIAGHAAAVLVDDTIILGINGFGCGQQHSGSRPCNATASALLQHLFAGAWKTGDAAPWHGGASWNGSGRRRRSGGGDMEDWRLPALALMAHARAHGIELTWEMVPLFCSQIVPIEPPLLPAPPAR